MDQAVNVSDFIEHRTSRRFLFLIVLTATLVVLFDGYELTTMSYAAPHLVTALGIERAAFTPIFTAGPVGNILGGLLFGYLGDRFGRKPVLSLAVVSYSLVSLAMAFATTIPEFLIARILSGIAVGGLIPVLNALVIEYSPTRWRATMVTLVMCGYLGGHILAGLISATLVPQFGWQILFWIGAVAPLLLLPVQWLLLPESVQFLASKGGDRRRIARILRRVSSDRTISDDAQFYIVRDAVEKVPGPPLMRLFAGRLRWITPCLWLSFICTSTTVFFLGSWTPLIMEGTGRTPSAAAFAASSYQLGGVIGSLLLARLLDKRGVITLLLMPLLASPILCTLGFLGAAPDLMLFAVMFLAGCLVLGGHHGLQAVFGLFYPTSLRATGAGWAYGVGRLGAVMGPFVGGMLLSYHLPIKMVLPFTAVPLLFFALMIVIIAMIQRRASRGGEDSTTPWPQ